MHVLGPVSQESTLCGIDRPTSIVASFQGDLSDFQRDKVRCPECLLRMDAPRFGLTRST